MESLLSHDMYSTGSKFIAVLVQANDRTTAKQMSRYFRGTANKKLCFRRNGDKLFHATL